MVTCFADPICRTEPQNLASPLLSVGFVRYLFRVKRPQATSEIRICFTEKWQAYGNGGWNLQILSQNKASYTAKSLALSKAFAVLCQEE